MQKSELFWAMFLSTAGLMLFSALGFLATEPSLAERSQETYPSSSTDDIRIYDGIQALPKGIDADAESCQFVLKDGRLILFVGSNAGTVVRFDCKGEVIYQDENIRTATWDVEPDGRWQVESEGFITDATLQYENQNIINSDHFASLCCMSSLLNPIAFLAMVISSRLEDRVMLEP